MSKVDCSGIEKCIKGFFYSNQGRNRTIINSSKVNSSTIPALVGIEEPLYTMSEHQPRTLLEKCILVTNTIMDC